MLTRVKKERRLPEQALAPSPTSMQELSQLLGVSRVTISKVINDRPGVAPETRQRILTAVRATGFQPNSLARGLRRQRTQKLGVLITGARGWTFSNWYYGEYLRGIVERAQETGFNVVLYTNRASPELAEDPGRLVRAREADALLLVGSNATATQIEPLLEWSIPFVVLGALPEGIGSNGVYYDNAAGAQLAVEHLIRLGHRRIGLLGSVGVSNARFMNLRLQGAIGTMRSFGLKPLGEDSYTVTLDGLARLVQTDGPCAVVSLVNTRQHVLQMQAEGLRIPEEVAMVGFNYPSSLYTLPSLTVVEQPLPEVGKHAVDRVVELLQNGQSVTPSELLPMRLIPRGSCGALALQSDSLGEDFLKEGSHV